MKNKNKDDLTRLEDISKFSHEEDEEAPGIETPLVESKDLIESSLIEEEVAGVESLDFQAEDPLEEVRIESENPLESSTDFSFDEGHFSEQTLTEEIMDLDSPIQQKTQTTSKTQFSLDELELPSSSSSEKLQEVKTFGDALTYGKISYGGNPPFSLTLKGITDEDEKEEILYILKEHGLLTTEQENSIQNNLARGNLLISHVSEYSAIYLAHKFRHLKAHMEVGPAHMVHPSSHYEDDLRGYVTVDNIKQNKSDYFPK